jgi:hypothetical protein
MLSCGLIVGIGRNLRGDWLLSDSNDRTARKVILFCFKNLKDQQSHHDLRVSDRSQNDSRSKQRCFFLHCILLIFFLVSVANQASYFPLRQPEVIFRPALPYLCSASSLLLSSEHKRRIELWKLVPALLGLGVCMYLFASIFLSNQLTLFVSNCRVIEGREDWGVGLATQATLTLKGTSLSYDVTCYHKRGASWQVHVALSIRLCLTEVRSWCK